MTTINFYNAPEYINRSNITDSTFNVFLAGPILGTSDWQHKAETYLSDYAKTIWSNMTINVFNPRRPEFTDLRDFSDDTFYEQVDWEHTHLELAKNKGVTLFWLANKSIDIPHRNYGLTTLFELGETIGNCRTADQALVVGIAPGFTNEKYLHYTINKKAPHAVIKTDLFEACGAVIASALEWNNERTKGKTYV